MTLPDAGFDRVAAFYDLLARLVFGRTLQRAQQAALAGLPPGAARLLIIGGGTGWVLSEVLRRRPQARILYVEASPAMLEKSRTAFQKQNPTRTAQVEFRLGTEDSLRSDERFEAILTFFFLDLFELSRLQHILHRLNAARAPDAPWLLADFYKTDTLLNKALLATMYGFFRLTTGISARQLPPFRQELAALGLQVQQQEFFFGGMIEAAVLTVRGASVQAQTRDVP